MTKLRAQMIVSGRVQGVGFRFSTKRKAKAFGICGWVKNLPDQTVEIEAEAEEEQLYQFIEEIKAGPSPAAKITDVKLSVSDQLNNYRSFKTR